MPDPFENQVVLLWSGVSYILDPLCVGAEIIAHVLGNDLHFQLKEHHTKLCGKHKLMRSSERFVLLSPPDNISPPPLNSVLPSFAYWPWNRRNPWFSFLCRVHKLAIKDSVVKCRLWRRGPRNTKTNLVVAIVPVFNGSFLSFGEDLARSLSFVMHWMNKGAILCIQTLITEAKYGGERHIDTTDGFRTLQAYLALVFWVSGKRGKQSTFF